MQYGPAEQTPSPEITTSTPRVAYATPFTFARKPKPTHNGKRTKHTTKRSDHHPPQAEREQLPHCQRRITHNNQRLTTVVGKPTTTAERHWCHNPIPNAPQHPRFHTPPESNTLPQDQNTPNTTHSHPNGKPTEILAWHTRFPHEQARIVRCVTGK